MTARADSTSAGRSTAFAWLRRRSLHARGADDDDDEVIAEARMEGVASARCETCSLQIDRRRPGAVAAPPAVAPGATGAAFAPCATVSVLAPRVARASRGARFAPSLERADRDRAWRLPHSRCARPGDSARSASSAARRVRTWLV